jgi:hypothetical protein
VKATTLPEAKTAVVEIKIYENKNKNKLLHTVITTYRRPTTQEQDKFIMEIQDEIENSQRKHPKTPVTLVGDTNIDILTKQTKYTQMMAETGMKTTITTPTRYDKKTDQKQTATLIDHIITSAKTKITAGTYNTYNRPPTNIRNIPHGNATTNTQKRKKIIEKQIPKTQTKNIRRNKEGNRQNNGQPYRNRQKN